jgi:hypothetical protein
MKKFNVLTSVLLCGILTISSVYAQNEVAILHQNGNHHYFDGANSLITALDSAQNGDTIYLSVGSFTAPSGINKGVMVLGAGHFPDTLTMKRRTSISSAITINGGADSLHLEGLYINGNITFQTDASINNVIIRRCRTSTISFNSATDSTSKNNCCIEECYVFGKIAQGWNGCWYGPSGNAVGNNLQIVRNIITRGYYVCSGSGETSLDYLTNAVIYRNIFLCNNPYFNKVQNSICSGNIFITSASNTIFSDCSNNQFENNLFNDTNIDFAGNVINNNFLGVPRDLIFINQAGIDINYSHNYRLQNPGLFLSSDGTQVGLYGGSTSFKELGRPFNPQVTQKNIGSEVLPNGTLPVNIKVESQDR